MGGRKKIAILITLAGMALPSIFCTTGYITPDSLTATARFSGTLEVQLPTVFLATETNTPSVIESETPTLEPEEGNWAQSPTPDLPTPTATMTATDTIFNPDQPPMAYVAQAGDTVEALTMRFAVQPEEIVSDSPLTDEGFITPGQILMIPLRLANTTPNDQLIPDSEIVLSPSTISFDPVLYVNTLGGHLTSHRQYLKSTGWTYGAEMVDDYARNNSINPRILLSLLQYQSNWVFGEPATISDTDYPMGYVDFDQRGLQAQLSWACNTLSIGYYGWRAGSLTELQFTDGTYLRLAPDLNAGTVAVMYFFSQVYGMEEWFQAISPTDGFLALHTTMFSDPLVRAMAVEPLFPPNLTQPDLILPFLINQRWSFSGGPHGAWEHDGSWAALDFAPGSIEHGCVDSDLWVTAVAPGLVVRKETGLVVVDLDGDGYEQTGWVIIYLHVTDEGKTDVGTWLDKSDLIGHPSCLGGVSTGTHVHIARKYNGEWMAADGPVPFILSGWRAHNGNQPYEGTLTKGDEIVPANSYGSAETKIMREKDELSDGTTTPTPEN
ncbi:MAG: hypothetical protein JXA19_02020 [Anaerolineales bacterium]|nr:hypothetical protein [Anaerolineales bacterium]